jgi:hypothetical protein
VLLHDDLPAPHRRPHRDLWRHRGTHASRNQPLRLFLGAAFQIRDDLLNLVGTLELYGKELLGDLHEDKRTLMLLHLMGMADQADRDWLATYLAQPIGDRRPSDTAIVLDLMHKYSSLEFASTWGHALATAADSSLFRFRSGIRRPVAITTRPVSAGHGAVHARAQRLEQTVGLAGARTRTGRC